MKLEFHSMDPREEADKTTKREETPMTTSPLFGIKWGGAMLLTEYVSL